jgi:peroxiredoxin
MRVKLWAFAVLLTVIGIITSASGLLANLSNGDKAPDFRLAGLDGKAVKLADLQTDSKSGTKRVVLLDFWATWCPPCRAETPHLQKLHEKYAKQGLIVVGISQDSDGAKSVRPYAEKNKLTYTQLLDQKHEAARKYGVSSIPTTFVVGRDGKIKSVHLGFAPGMEKRLEEEVVKLLK